MIALLGCATPEEPRLTDTACERFLWYEDRDGDGAAGDHVSRIACAGEDDEHRERTDCDDEDPARFPGAVEVCNEVDDDCDGYRDEEAVDAQIGCADADHDNHGSTTTTLTCEAVDPALPCDDCDDDNRYVSPSRWEECDDYDVDENCDGVADGEDASGRGRWYLDEDGDGYGSGDVVRSCDAPEGYAERDGDCATSDRAVFPDAPETCGDGIDSDCDDSQWDFCLPVRRDFDDADARFASEDAADMFADAAVAPGDLDADGLADIVLTFPSAKEAFVFDGTSIGDVVAGSATARIFGDTAQHVSGAGDVDGDGLDDLAVSSNVSGGVGGGLAWILSAPVTGSIPLSAAWGTISGLPCCMGVSGGGDLDGDGTVDLLVGEGLDSTAALYMLPRLTAGENDLADAWTLAGDDLSLVQRFLLVDDDGDGLDNLIAGDEVLYFFDAPIAGNITTDDAAGTLAARGWSTTPLGLAHAGDIDGDGDDDVVVGARDSDRGSTDVGEVYVLAGADAPVAGSAADMVSATLVGLDDARIGPGVDGGDFDGDRHGDVVVVAAGKFGPEAGALIFLGPLSGTTAVDQAGAGVTTTGSWPGRSATATAVPDVDSDGDDELLLTAPGVENWTGNDGAAWLFRGGDWVRP